MAKLSEKAVPISPPSSEPCRDVMQAELDSEVSFSPASVEDAVLKGKSLFRGDESESEAKTPFAAGFGTLTGHSKILPLIAVVGPTASGKSAVALKIALALNGEIVSCDSQDVYRLLDIGTAKPSAADQRLVPHHLIDICEPVSQMSAGEYVRLADRAIEDIRSRQRPVIIAGGTGLWLRALIFGMAAIPESRPEVRAALEEDLRKSGSAALYQKLCEVDSAAAEKIGRNNGIRLVRALEIFQLTGRPPSAIWAEHAFRTPRYDARIFALNPPRGLLYDRIALRTEAMFSGGLLDEVRRLDADGLSESAAFRTAIGYSQALAVIRGEKSLESAIEETVKFSRRYAKRQWTWFRAEKNVEWLLESDPEAAAEEILNRLEAEPEAAEKRRS